MSARSFTPLLLLVVCLTTHGYGPMRDEGVRLVGGKKSFEGRVEVYHNGHWGTVCDDGWEMAEAQVVCRQLGFPGAKSAVRGGVYGPGSGHIWLDDLDCKGTESSLSSCGFKGWGVTDCSHNEDAGVICEKDVTLNNSRVYPLDHSSGLSAQLGELFGSGRGCDFTITVQTAGGTPKEDRICTHSLILSLYPDSAFFNATKGSDGFTMEVVRSVAPSYLYTRQIDVTVASAHCLHQLASDLSIPQLQEDSGRLFTWMLPQDGSFHTQVSLYEYSVQTRDPVLQETCLQYLAWNCESLMGSPAWGNLSRDALQALLSRSDLVVPDEAFVLRGLESWVQSQKGSLGGCEDEEAEAALLREIRFPMMSAEHLYDLQFTSDLYARHSGLYREGTLEGFQFNVLPFITLKKHMETQREQHSPRIYTAAPWSLYVNSTDRQREMYNHYSSYPNGVSKYFQTPVHNSAFFRANSITWSTEVFLSQRQCSNRGLSCDIVPSVWMMPSNGDLSRYRDTVRYSNKVVLSCDGEYVFHVQDFKDKWAWISGNFSSLQSYPCYTDQFFYRFVVTPEYVL
ncbi:hypothetical protein AGOR_G00195960 [Albula goreensis]|uniref:SRCR domain-containing protein n=1 Tax=Albula goreensis TaxID=1534307 RepID=A0A8T3CVF7_9TELE|nr:hypothetical protein AGOR_G00195960 [Albula goreensis]